MRYKLLVIALFWLQFTNNLAWQKTTSPRLVIVTVATEETDGFKRFRKSANEFGHELHVFGMGQKWNGGNMESEVDSALFFQINIHLLGRRPKNSIAGRWSSKIKSRSQ